MKLFPFWRKAAAPAPVTINTTPPAPGAMTQPVVKLLPLLILKVVQAFPNRGEDRALRRFFEKTSVDAPEVLQCRQQLYEKGLLQTGILKQGVQYFTLSEAGMLHLEKHYDQDAMLAYVLQLEPKGFIATLLRNVAEKKQPEL